MNFKRFNLIILLVLFISIVTLLYFNIKNNLIETKWLNYLLEQDIQEITITKNFDNNKKTINVSDLRNIFIKLDNYGIKRVFSEIKTDESEYTLSIYYMIDDIGYFVIFEDERINISNDNKLIDFINEDYLYNEYDESSSIETETYYFAFDKFNKKVFSKYFK